MSRAPFIPREILEPLIRTHRAQGMTWKEIARSLGKYHPTYLSLLGSMWNRDSIDCAVAVAHTQPKGNDAGDGIRASAVNANTSAASEATPSDTPTTENHSGSNRGLIR